MAKLGLDRGGKPETALAGAGWLETAGLSLMIANTAVTVL